MSQFKIYKNNCKLIFLCYTVKMLLTYEYRLKPTKQQYKALSNMLSFTRNLYNSGLEERINCYQKTGKSISCFDQFKSLSDIQKIEGYENIPINLMRWTIKKLDLAMKSFFSRVRTGKKPGFPRFKSFSRHDSFGFNEFSGIVLKQEHGKYWLLSKFFSGKLKINLHRAFPKEYQIKSCVFKQDIKGWKICFQLFVPDIDKSVITDDSKIVGVDVGLEKFLTCSDGTIISNPRIGKKYEKKLRIAQRKLSRAKKGSKRRKKTRLELQRIHQKIVNIRKNFLHQISRQLVNNYDVLVFEDLTIKNMVKNHCLAKSIHDVSWGNFIEKVFYKAEGAGKIFLKVNARYTSQTCSHCGNREKKLLSQRVHDCKNCGTVLDRDLNASINIKNAGVVELTVKQEALHSCKQLMTRRVANAECLTHTFTQNTQ